MPHIPDAVHARHDLELIVGFAADELDPADRGRARSLIDRCAECASLDADIRAISTAIVTLPAPARRRDFRLSRDDAARLRPGGIRGFLRTLSGPRFAFAAPLGSGIAALGLVGVLVASGIAPGAQAPIVPDTTFRAATSAAAPSPAAAARDDTLGTMEIADGAADGSADGSPGADTIAGLAPKASLPAAPEGGTAAPAPAALNGPVASMAEVPASRVTDQSPLLVPAAALLLAGLVILAVRLGSRRLA